MLRHIDEEFMNFAAITPILLLLGAFVGYCLYDISRVEVKHLPKWAWVLIVVISIPLGGIIYLVVGRDPQ